MTDEAVTSGKSEIPAAAVAEASVGPSPAPRPIDSIGFVMDVPVEVTVEIGRRTMKIGEILRLGAGSVLELEKAAGEPLEVYVNNRPIARGEAVVVGDHYGVRLTEVLVVDADRARKGASE